MIDPKKAAAEDVADDTDVEGNESQTAEVHDVTDTDDDVDDAGDDQSDDGSEDLGDADDVADHDGSEADDARSDNRQAAEGKPLSRAERRIQALNERTQRAEAAAEAAAREIAQIRAERADRQTAAQREAEEERLRLMDPAERAEYKAQKLEEKLGQTIGRLEFQQTDISDRTKFDGFLSRRPELAKHADEVERELGALRRNGLNVPRETVLWTIIGRNAVNKAPAAKTRAAKRGAENIQRQSARPSKGGGDVQRGNNRSGSEAEKRRARLADQNI